ncbi:hypothetical protein [Pelagicoccus sp. SDUM812003]|uniref:hypothetical protein n=1 Tax=Pelagicoccus sp. SDUM812003 TaxID=3041267 RepID=UPI002810576A|nr:hypothetical protein [Pelagicoccus sp. SDUM812003]MDQ8205388.1 hypothetical protein [Pelagicoccus sp. SDUM812003]
MDSDTSLPANSERLNTGGSLVYSEAELDRLFTKLEAERQNQELEEADRDEDPDLQVFTLRAVEVSPLDFDLYQRFDLALRTEANDSLRNESETRRRLRLEKLYIERADQRFWSGEYDGGRDADVPEVGSVDLSKLFDGLSNLLGKEKDREFNLSER